MRLVRLAVPMFGSFNAIAAAADHNWPAVAGWGVSVLQSIAVIILAERVES